MRSFLEREDSPQALHNDYQIQDHGKFNGDQNAFINGAMQVASKDLMDEGVAAQPLVALATATGTEPQHFDLTTPAESRDASPLQRGQAPLSSVAAGGADDVPPQTFVFKARRPESAKVHAPAAASELLSVLARRKQMIAEHGPSAVP